VPGVNTEHNKVTDICNHIITTYEVVFNVMPKVYAMFTMADVPG
jgi:hypothetical protein